MVSAGEKKVETAVPGCEPRWLASCGEFSAGDPEGLVCEALNDPISPGFIDAGELNYYIGSSGDAMALFDAIPLVKDPPLLARLSSLEQQADQQCFLGACLQGKAEAAKEFEQLVTQPGVLLLLPMQKLLEVRQLALRMSVWPTDSVQQAGRVVLSKIDEALAARGAKTGTPYAPVFDGAVSYLGPQFEFLPPTGLTTHYRYWQRIWSSPWQERVKACSMTKAIPKEVVVEEPKPKAVQSCGKKGAKAHSKKAASCSGKKATAAPHGKRPSAVSVKKTVLTCPGADEEVSVQHGKLSDLTAGIANFLPWQPYLEAAFVKQGLPPYMALLAIPESGMEAGQVNRRSGATGPYQIMSSNTNIPDFDIVQDPAVGIDERKNPYFAACAAALLLASNKRRIMQAKSNGGKDGYIDGVVFDESLATIMTTSAYHAGAGTLAKALRQAKEELTEMGKPITGENLFVHILTSGTAYKTFREQSKDYPVKLMPVIDAVYSAQSPFMGEAGAAIMEDLSVMEITAFASPTGINDILRMTHMTKQDFLQLNPHLDWAKTAEAIALNPKTVKRLRLVIPTSLALRLAAGLIYEQRVEPSSVAVHKILAPQAFASQMGEVVGADEYATQFSRGPTFPSLE